MRSICTLFSRFSDLVQKISLIVCGICLISMLLIAGLGVFSRFILHSSLSWNEEIDGYLFVWLTCLGAAVGYKFRAHPSVEVFVDRFPPVLKKIATTIADLIVLSLGIIFLTTGQQMVVLLGTETASSLQFLSMGYAYAAIPAGGICLLIHSISHMLNTWFNTVDASDKVHGKEEMVWEH